MKITLCMIVKNEEQYIEMCLNEALKIVDEAIIVDTGSTDKTKELILQYGDKVKLLESPWKNDFAEARNKSIEQATGDWILVLDADEKILSSREKLEEILANTEYEGFSIPIYSIVTDMQVMYSCVYCKLYRNKGYRYEGAIHENIMIPNGKIGALDSEVCKVIHYGYLETNMKNRKKVERNTKILKQQIKEKPNDPYVNYNIGNSYLVKGEYDKALNHFIKAHKLSRDTFPAFKSLMLLTIAECLIKLRDYDTCISYLTTLMKDGNENSTAELTYMLGYCYWEKGDLVNAERVFRDCINIGERKNSVSIIGYGSYLPRYMLARIYAKKGDITNAVMNYMEGIFSPHNYLRIGKDEIRAYLIENKLDVILNELDTLLQN